MVWFLVSVHDKFCESLSIFHLNILMSYEAVGRLVEAWHIFLATGAALLTLYYLYVRFLFSYPWETEPIKISSVNRSKNQNFHYTCIKEPKFGFFSFSFGSVFGSLVFMPTPTCRCLNFISVSWIRPKHRIKTTNKNNLLNFAKHFMHLRLKFDLFVILKKEKNYILVVKEVMPMSCTCLSLVSRWSICTPCVSCDLACA